MTVDPTEFAEFFRAVNGGNEPFAWQQRLFDHLVEHGSWPAAINAPTGTGKSNVVDVHVFVNALRGWGAPVSPPRRLAVVVNRRGLVDAHESRTEDLIGQLRVAEPGTLLARVAEGLGRVRRKPETGANIVLARIRGGAALDSAWIDDPTACAVICATPDMWGSRLLFHGYGTSRLARPREAGLLAYDSVMILDEAHLNEQLLRTATRTAELLARYPDPPAPPLHVVSTTATQLGDGGTVIGVDDGDIATDSVLRDRLTKPKPVTYSPSLNWQPRRVIDKYIDDIVEEVIAMADDPAADGTIGCVVNRVETAVKVATKLKDRFAGRRRHEVLSWVGPMRRLDLTRYAAQHPGVFTPDGDPEVAVVVATQTIEVGVNVDFAGMVTELAPGSSLAQRAGRVNRLGKRANGPIVVIGPDDPPTVDPVPYSAADIAHARTWVLERAATPEGLNPLCVLDAPRARRQREVISRLESGDVFALAPTSEDRPARPELDLWLHDSLEADRPQCGIVLRGGLPQKGGRPLPADSLDALAVLQATPPDPIEVFPTPLYRALGICMKLAEDSGGHGRAFRYRDGTVDILDITADALDVAPGDILILDADHPIVSAHTIVDFGSGGPEPITAWGSVDLDAEGDVDVAVQFLWRASDPRLFAELDDLAESDNDESDDEVAAVVERQQLVLENHGYQDCQVTVGSPFPSDDAVLVPWVVIRPNRFVKTNEATRQTWNGADKVPLDQHSKAVAARAREIAETLGLPDDLQCLLELAGRHHDDGKRDRRFQRMLGGTKGEPLAKSGGPSARRTTTFKTRTGLPSGWRHEQLSVVYAQVAAPEVADADLLLRLVGTSHGWGRANFPHNGDELMDPAERDDELQAVARELFTAGAWEELIEATDRRHGPWACAYYEALLRAADCGVSKEGS